VTVHTCVCMHVSSKRVLSCPVLCCAVLQSVIEAANAPTTLEGDKVLRERGIPVCPGQSSSYAVSSSSSSSSSSYVVSNSSSSSKEQLQQDNVAVTRLVTESKHAHC
jgi:glutamate dehydrogenase/leucine dehydrogenase